MSQTQAGKPHIGIQATSRRKDTASDNGDPFAVPVLLVAPKVDDAAQDAVL